MQYRDIAALSTRLMENIGKVMIGKTEQIELLMAALLAKGHVLMEDVPGTGKTLLARSLALSLDMVFSRIQFTPDLLPADITGMSVYQPKEGTFVYHPGPVFTNICLADEINRATPRTQAALLECMEEKQVTESGVTRRLDVPFMVIATQNPIEIQGTFPLPEAQLDRFLLRLSLGYPDGEEALRMMQRFIQNDPVAALRPVAGKQELCEAQALVGSCQVAEPIMRYIAALCQATRVQEQVQLGASARGMLALMRACQALAAVQGRDYVIPDDVKRLAVPVLAHRLVVRGLYGKADAAQQIITKILTEVPVPTEEKP